MCIRDSFSRFETIKTEGQFAAVDLGSGYCDTDENRVKVEYTDEEGGGENEC